MIRVNTEEDCPTNNYSPGEPAGKCWGDGHYECTNCVFFRNDFKIDSSKKDVLLSGQASIQVLSYEQHQHRFR